MVFKRQMYKGFVLDHDNLGRPYVYNQKSPYSEDSDRDYCCGRTLKEIKAYINFLRLGFVDHG